VMLVDDQHKWEYVDTPLCEGVRVMRHSPPQTPHGIRGQYLALLYQKIRHGWWRSHVATNTLPREPSTGPTSRFTLRRVTGGERRLYPDTRRDKH